MEMTMGNPLPVAAKTADEPVWDAQREGGWSGGGVGGILSRLSRALYQHLPAPVLQGAPPSHVTMGRTLMSSVRSECVREKIVPLCYAT